MMRVGLCTAFAVGLFACDAPRERETVVEPSARVVEAEAPLRAGPSDRARVAAARRVVAIGDLHGDIAATRRALRLAGAIDEAEHWVGGRLVVVQVGDQLDRGDDEPEILTLLDRLEEEARAAGGALHVLVGNHEHMNAAGDLRYVTPEGLTDFAEAEPGAFEAEITRAPEEARGRLRAFLPGSRWARWFATHRAALIVGDTLFVHGGLEPEVAARGLDAVNDALRRYFETGDAPDPLVIGAHGPLWSRELASSPSPDVCRRAARTLAALEVRRIVVGHTVQEGGVKSYCGGSVWAIDVGLSAHYGGPTEVLVIEGGRANVLR